MIRPTREIQPTCAVLSPEDYVVEPCGDDCLLHELPPLHRIASNGLNRTQLVAVGSDRLWTAWPTSPRSPDHYLYWPTVKPTGTERLALTSKIRIAQPPHVCSVYGSCTCSLEIGIIPGTPLISAGTRPPWHRDHFPDRTYPLPWSLVARALADLADGLLELHGLGIAHGDPVGWNSILSTHQSCRWVDLGEISPLTSITQALDIWGFLCFTVLPVIADAEAVYGGSVGAILNAYTTDPLDSILSNVRDHLLSASDAAVSPVSQPESLAAIGLELHQHVISNRADELGEVARRRAHVGLFTLNRAYLWNRALAAEQSRAIAAQSAANRYSQSDVLRIIETVGEWKSEPSPLNLQGVWRETLPPLSELLVALQWNAAQHANWQRTAQALQLRLSEQDEYTQALLEGKLWLEQQVINWRTEAERLSAEAEELRNSQATAQQTRWNKKIRDFMTRLGGRK